MDRGMPILGVVFDVTRDLVYSAAAGEGAWLGNQRLHARTTPLDQSSMLMLTSNLLDTHGRCPAWASRFIGQTDWKVRMLGSAALEAIQVAAGVAHGCFTVNGKLWDIAAPAAVLLEAGAVITDLHGRAIFPFDLSNYQGAKVPFLAAGPARMGNAGTAPNWHDCIRRVPPWRTRFAELSGFGPASFARSPKTRPPRLADPTGLQLHPQDAPLRGKRNTLFEQPTSTPGQAACCRRILSRRGENPGRRLRLPRRWRQQSEMIMIPSSVKLPLRFPVPQISTSPVIIVEPSFSVCPDSSLTLESSQSLHLQQGAHFMRTCFTALAAIALSACSSAFAAPAVANLDFG